MHARIIILCLLAVMGLAVAEDKFDFKSHFFFKHMLGEWVTEGELKGADGNVIKLKEEWKAEALGDNTLVIEGRRQLNDDSQNYKWTITHNPSTGLLEAAYRFSDDNPETLRFEINLSEAEMKMEMTGLLGGSNGKAVIVDTFAGDDRDAFKGEFTLTDDSGATTLSGTLKSTRSKKQP